MIDMMLERLKNRVNYIRFIAQEKGTVAIEFAMTLPIWIALLLGCSDLTYMMIVSQRVDRITYSVTDIVTQSEVITRSDLDTIMLAAGQMMQPFEFGDNGIVIVSSVHKPTGQTPRITWQHIGGGTLARSSKVGTTNGTPAMPNGLILNDNEHVIITEVYYHFDPMFIDAGPLKESDVYRSAIYKPRLSPLITPPT